ncbi:MAG: GNAT family N-acetyltransferase [Pseudomonadota bacterium]
MSALLAPAVAAPYRIHRYPSMLIDRLTLSDARVVTVRPVLPQDVDAERSFVSDLSPHSRRLRFHGAVNALPDSLLQAMTAIDYQDHVALIAEAIDEDGAGRLVADARYVVDDAGGAEFAIAVADDWQHIGLGSALLKRLGRHAHRQGLQHLEGAVLVSNGPMLALMRRWGAALRPDPDDSDVLIATLRCRA